MSTNREPVIRDMLSKLDVTTGHVRTLAPQCFLYVAAVGQYDAVR